MIAINLKRKGYRGEGYRGKGAGGVGHVAGLRSAAGQMTLRGTSRQELLPFSFLDSSVQTVFNLLDTGLLTLKSTYNLSDGHPLLTADVRT